MRPSTRLALCNACERDEWEREREREQIQQNNLLSHHHQCVPYTLLVARLTFYWLSIACKNIFYFWLCFSFFLFASPSSNELIKARLTWRRAELHTHATDSIPCRLLQIKIHDMNDSDGILDSVDLVKLIFSRAANK